MTNFEKWQIELENLIKAERTYPAIVKGKPRNCNGIACCDCDFDVCEDSCLFEFLRWLFKEYKEQQKLTKRQRGFLEALQTGFLWRIRGNLCWFEEKQKETEQSCVFKGKFLEFHTSAFPDFPFIKEEDGQYSIEEMLTWEVEDGNE